MKLLQIVSDKPKGTRVLKHFNYITQTFFGIKIGMLNFRLNNVTINYNITINNYGINR